MTHLIAAVGEAPTSVSGSLRITVALTRPESLDRLWRDGPPPAETLLGEACRPEPYLALLEGSTIDRVQLGTEFCETLIPSPEQTQRAVERASALGIGLGLVSPICSDAGIAQLRRLLPLLGAGTEVVANDWGTLRLLSREFADLVPVAGRLLCKQIKDPRLPSAEWAALYPHGIHSTGFGAVLGRFGVERLEMDVPPFFAAENFQPGALPIGFHLPYGFAVKGRSCRIGSLRQADGDKFATGHRCHKECLTFTSSLRRSTGSADLPTRQRGNTVFYGHSATMAANVAAAVRHASVDRLILAGDWP